MYGHTIKLYVITQLQNEYILLVKTHELKRGLYCAGTNLTRRPVYPFAGRHERVKEIGIDLTDLY